MLMNMGNCVKFMFRELFPCLDIQLSPEIAVRLYYIIIISKHEIIQLGTHQRGVGLADMVHKHFLFSDFFLSKSIELLFIL